MTLYNADTRRLLIEAHRDWLWGWHRDGDDLYLWLGLISISWERP